MINFVSYNCHGFGPTQIDYTGKLCNQYDFVFVQEQWLLEENLASLHDSIPGVTSHGVSAMDSSILLSGRPHGGCSILWKTSLICIVSPVNTGNRRVCAVIIDLPFSKILLTNIYMPIDSKYDRENVSVFEEDLPSVSAISRLHDIDFII